MRASTKHPFLHLIRARMVQALVGGALLGAGLTSVLPPSPYTPFVGSIVGALFILNAFGWLNKLLRSYGE